MCFIVVLCFFSRMSFENVSSICPHSGIFWLLSAKDAFHLLLMVFLVITFFLHVSVIQFLSFLLSYSSTIPQSAARRGFARSLRNSIASGFPFLLQYGAYFLLVSECSSFAECSAIGMLTCTVLDGDLLPNSFGKDD